MKIRFRVHTYGWKEEDGMKITHVVNINDLQKKKKNTRGWNLLTRTTTGCLGMAYIRKDKKLEYKGVLKKVFCTLRRSNICGKYNTLLKKFP